MVMISIGSLFELLGLGIIFLFIDFIFLKQFSNNNFIAQFINLNNFSNLELTYLVIVLYLIKNIYLCFLEYLRRSFLANSQIKFQNNIINQISKGNEKIFHKFHLTSIIKNLINESHIAFDLFSNSFFELIAECALLIIIMSFLFYQTEIKLYFFYILIILTFIIIFFITSKKFLKKLGNKRSSSLNSINQIITKFVYLFNNLKLNNQIDLYKNKLDFYAKEYAYNSSKFLFLRAAPKYMIEVSFVLIITFFVFINSNSNSNLGLVIFVGLIFVRLFPSFIRIKTNLDNIFFSKQAILNLKYFKDSVSISQLSKKEILYNLKFNKKISFENLYFKYNKNIIFKNSKLDIHINNIIGVVGKSGSGKSTLLRIIAGLEDPDNMSIIVDNKKLTETYQRPIIDIVFQSLYLPSGKFLDHLKELSIFNHKLILNYYNLMGLKKELGPISKLELIDNGSNLSQGQKQRLCILRSIINQPDILILDEPSSNIDIHNIYILKDILKVLKKKITIIIVTHDSYIYDLFDYYYLIKDKKLVRKNIHEFKN